LTLLLKSFFKTLLLKSSFLFFKVSFLRFTLSHVFFNLSWSLCPQTCRQTTAAMSKNCISITLKVSVLRLAFSNAPFNL
jgi:hypothetical protein